MVDPRMPATQAMPREQKVAVVDDNPDNRATLCSLANHGGMTAIAIDAADDLDRMVAQIRAKADVAITDLRLSESWPVSFDGAELAAALFRLTFPVVVVSEYAQDDAETVLRTHRRFLPAVVPADAATTIDAIRQPLTACSEELAGHVPRSRRAWRSLVRVEGITVRQGKQLLEVVVPEWDPNRRVRFPLAMVPVTLHPTAAAGKRLFAKVNTDAESPDELFFYDFEAAPEPAL
jgi:CheY-like chemotaxis protein